MKGCLIFLIAGIAIAVGVTLLIASLTLMVG